MRVLLVSGSYPPMKCGVGDYTQQLAHALANVPGLEVGVLTSQSAGDAPNSRVEVMPHLLSWHASQATTAVRSLRSWRPNVVHIQYPTQGYAGALANLMPLISKLCGATVVQTWHEPMDVRDFLLRRLVPSEIIAVRPNLRALLPPLARLMLQGKTLHYIRGASSLPVARLNDEEAQALRQRYLSGQQRLVVFFGFVYPHKGVHRLFEIADPELDHIVIAGNLDVDMNYRARLFSLAQESWAGKVTFTGFISRHQAAELLSVSDAVVLPFLDGGGEWNSSIHGATVNGAYVVTTSTDRRGYDPIQNVAYTEIDSVAEMRAALALSNDRRRSGTSDASAGWDAVVARHLQVYQHHRQNPDTDRALV
jgi:glycosyltransferase involved in cell wall biosynthesis